MPGEPVLTGTQAAALLDILTHHGTYAEIEAFKQPGAVTSYGFPFRGTTRVPVPAARGAGRGMRTATPTGSAPSTPRARTPVSSFLWGREERKEPVKDEEEEEEEDKEEESMSPLLQMLLTRLVLPFPGVRELSREFWGVRVQGLLARFGEADLSESYDKGALGTRKTLAGGAASVLEMLARGVLWGVAEEMRADDGDGDCTYELGDGRDLERAWDGCVQRWAYGGLLDELFDRFARTEDIEEHSLAIRAAVDYAIVHLATFAHQIFVLSPEGQYLVKLLEGINNLIPYRMITQTLRVGNAAVMISGMVRLLLTKLSVTSLTNWVGLTASADDGMNLLQRIIWIVLSYDASEFRKSADRVERAAREGEEEDADSPPEEVLLTIREHMAKSRDKHDAVRRASAARAQSIVAAILEGGKVPAASLSEGQHARCLAYHSALLSARDRDAIVAVLCRQAPDLFTQAMRDVIAAFEPIIRSVHARVDLREHLEALQKFVSDFIRVSKPRKPEGSATVNQDDKNEQVKRAKEETRATVEDYVKLLRSNKRFLYKWIHAVAKGCPDVWADLRIWAKAVAAEFRERAVPKSKKAGQPDDDDDRTGPLKDMRGCLDDMFASLAPETRERILAAVDAHADYLSEITLESRRRLQSILDRSASPAPKADADADADAGPGPGIYLSRWQDILDRTPITPREASGALRRGRDVRHATTMGKLGPGGTVLDADWGPDRAPRREAPDVGVVVDALGDKFRVAVREKSVMWDGLARKD